MHDYVPLACPRCGAPLDPGDDETIECAYCGTRLFLHRRAPASAGARPPGGAPLSPRVVRDSTTGLPALYLMAPEEWPTEGGVSWLPGRPAAPAQLELRISHPTEPVALEIFPTQYFVWIANAPMGPAPGTLYFGSEVRPPVSPEEAVRTYLLPRVRSQPVEIVSAEPDPTWARRVHDVDAPPPNAQAQREGIKVHTRYALNGVRVTEVIRAVLDYVRLSVPAGWTMMETTYWDITRAVAYHMPHAQADTYTARLSAMADSLEVNPQWIAAVQQISQVMVQNQIQHIHQIGDTARRIARQHAEMSDQLMDSWRRRQDVMDRTAAQFSEAIRGVDAYHDPFTDRQVELPSGYKEAWATPLGDYLLSDDPTFDPNQTSNLSWTRISRRRGDG
jgi:DNA-directed RNA polymerase subunit RPC12/RpoP